MDMEIPSEVQDVKGNDGTRDGKEGHKDGTNGETVGLDGEGSASAEKEETKTDEKPEVQMSDKYNEDDADLTIISSDSVAFKVHSNVISRVSPVLKSMIGLAKSSTQRDPITLSHHYVEHSLVVRAALDIIYDREITSFDECNTLLYVIEFARKWDISVITKVMMKEIKLQCSVSKNLITMFFIAIELADHDTIATVVKTMSTGYWGDVTIRAPPDSDILPYGSITMLEPCPEALECAIVRGTSIGDLGGWSWELFSETPKPILWAMLRARQAAQADEKVIRSARVSYEMKKVLSEMYHTQANQAASAGGEGGEGAV